MEPGSFSVNNGNGGASVGSFNWSLTLPPYVVPTNIPASVIAPGSDAHLDGGLGVPRDYLRIQRAGGEFGAGFSRRIHLQRDRVRGAVHDPVGDSNLLPTNGYGAEGVPGVDLQIAGYATVSFTGSSAPGLAEGFLSAFASSGGISTVRIR